MLRTGGISGTPASPIMGMHPSDTPGVTSMSTTDSPNPEDVLADANKEVADLIKQAEQASGGAPGASADPFAGGMPFQLPVFDAAVIAKQSRAIDLLSDVNLNVKIELGRTRLLVDDVLKLSEGAVVELDKLAGDPVDVFVNDRLVARGEVLVLNDNFCVRINEILAAPADAAPLAA
jgi:flagellar motor switch protein FliN/FliY